MSTNRINLLKTSEERTMFPPPFELIECIDLYNILNAEIHGLARISDTNYLYLLGLFAS